jgi:hypothetical protein
MSDGDGTDFEVICLDEYTIIFEVDDPESTYLASDLSKSLSTE